MALRQNEPWWVGRLCNAHSKQTHPNFVLAGLNVGGRQSSLCTVSRVSQDGTSLLLAVFRCLGNPDASSSKSVLIAIAYLLSGGVLVCAGVEDSDIMQGFVISSFRNPVPMCTQFEAQLMIVELLEHNPIFTVRVRHVYMCVGMYVRACLSRWVRARISVCKALRNCPSLMPACFFKVPSSHPSFQLLPYSLCD
eukprot:1146622-Pelagomonas_calceolata.AAC.6